MGDGNLEISTILYWFPVGINIKLIVGTTSYKGYQFPVFRVTAKNFWVGALTFGTIIFQPIYAR
jgi:hypothetical protein